MDGLTLSKVEAMIYGQSVRILESNGIAPDLGYVVMKNVCARMCESAYLAMVNRQEQPTAVSGNPRPAEGEENGNN